MPGFCSSDESFSRLQRAGWTVGDVAVHGPEDIHWLVTGTNGENRIEARGASQAEAWQRALQQAEAVGMAGRPLLSVDLRISFARPRALDAAIASAARPGYLRDARVHPRTRCRPALEKGRTPPLERLVWGDRMETCV